MGKFHLFGRTGNQSGHKEASTEEHLSQLQHSSDAVGWGTVDHGEPDSWAGYRADFPRNVASYISAANPDMYNGRFMEREIGCYEQLAVTEARGRREKNGRSIHNIRISQRACLRELELAIARLEEELTHIEKEVSKC